MAERYGFFDALVTNGQADRIYSANDVNEIFKGLISDGVFRMYENALQVTAGNGLSVSVNTGKAIIKEHWYINNSIMNIALIVSHPTMDRIDSIVLRFDRVKRDISLKAVAGTPASVPTQPTLTRNNDIYEMRIANINVSANSTNITDSDIVDKRTYVTGIVEVPEIVQRRYDTIQNTYASGSKSFDIPSEYNITFNTKLEVYCNGLLCRPDEYTLSINDTTGNYMVVFNENREYGAELSFVMTN